MARNKFLKKSGFNGCVINNYTNNTIAKSDNLTMHNELLIINCQELIFLAIYVR